MTAPQAPTDPSPTPVADEGDLSFVTIEHAERVDPFMVSVLSATDRWMFATSNGGVTAGRGDAAGAVFPYETVDRLYQRPGHGGPLTRIRTQDGTIWQPLIDDGAATPRGRRVSKSGLGDELRYEETHPSLPLGWRASWRASQTFGWVREVELSATSQVAVEVDLLDGFLDVLPAQVDPSSQQRASNLVDAYRHTELHLERRSLALYGLSSRLTDRAEPSESLRVNVVWRLGLEGPTFLSPRTPIRWVRGGLESPESRLRGQKGAYLVAARVRVAPGKSVRWRMVVDAALDHRELAELSTALAGPDIEARLEADLAESRRRLEALAASVDGFQRTGHRVADLNHLSNALFNGLRGGFFLDGGRIPRGELASFLRLHNRAVAEAQREWVDALPERLGPQALREAADGAEDPTLRRLVDEVLPLAFGRRHGDPSRPWNQFSIRVRGPDGQPYLHYEGNWRDIFQNWEALSVSYPQYLPSFVTKFVDATTNDGFNPYRLSRDGIDWEVPDPEDPWSNIGYWGDHQIIYLLRLLEALERSDPAALDEMLGARRFTFADVPYRLADFDAMLRDPTETITFDETKEAEVADRVARVGADGRLLVDRSGQIARTHLWEKLLVPFLNKVSNLVPDGGIWMNTQRPEWNDANNALPGWGLSVVTLAHTLRFARFLARLVVRAETSIPLPEPLLDWLGEVSAALRDLATGPAQPSAQDRRQALERWGRAFSRYRDQVYGVRTGAEQPLDRGALERLLADAVVILERGLRANRRTDGLFHAYNTMRLTDDGVEVEPLQAMLEGQVAAIDAGILSADEVADLVDAMYASPLYRPDQDSFLLYPDRRLPDFEERNHVPDDARSIPVVRDWLGRGDRRVIGEDASGRLRFAAHLRNHKALETTLDQLAADGVQLTPADRAALLDAYERTFDHRRFTGRSGGMYGFEGLGCIYWHMVAKLLVGVGETHARAVRTDEPVARIRQAYMRIRRGFNFNKSPEVYGAFPTDAYSHTPGHSGAQQPGMTGQVKEQILTRFGELGVQLSEGRLRFDPRLLHASDLLSQPLPVSFRGAELTLPGRALAFTWAEVPIVYHQTEGEERVRIVAADGSVREQPGLELSREDTRALLGRTGSILRLEVGLDEERFIR